MARCGFATWNPKGTTPGGKIDPRVVVFHVTAGHGNAQPHSGLEWHFEVSFTGQLEQQVDTNLRADANYKANPFAISIETEGKGEGSWTDAQLDTLVRLSHWCIDVHPKVKAQRCDAWDGSGFGYHVMWGAPGPWTPVAKSCPGPRRIAQFDAELLPRILSPLSPPPPEEDDLPLNDTDKAWLQAAIDQAVATAVAEVRKVPGWVAGEGSKATLEDVIGEVRKVPGWVRGDG